MRKFKESLSLVILFSILCSYGYAEYNHEAIPSNHSIGIKIVEDAKNTSIYNLTYGKIINYFNTINERGSITDFRYVLLEMQFGSDWYKGSGTILYNDGKNVLVLTALHNIEDSSKIANKLEVYSDGKHIPKVKIAEVLNVGNDYVRIPNKDIALFIAKLNSSAKSKKYVPQDVALFDIKRLEKISYPGSYYKVEAVMNQYPSQTEEYFRIKDNVYYDNQYGKMIGYSNIPTLAGASGSSVIYYDYNCWFFGLWCNKDPEECIIGVHVKSGNLDKKISPSITHAKRKIMVENNIFELISQKEIKNLSSTNTELNNLLSLFIGGQKHEDL